MLYPSDYEQFRPKKTNIQPKGAIGELNCSRPNRLFVYEYGIKEIYIFRDEALSDRTNVQEIVKLKRAIKVSYLTFWPFSILLLKKIINYFTSTWTMMLLDSCISMDTWLTFNFEYRWCIWYLMWHHDLRYGTMCNLRYVNKAADKAAVCHLILNPSWGFLVQHSSKRNSSLR